MIKYFLLKCSVQVDNRNGISNLVREIVSSLNVNWYSVIIIWFGKLSIFYVIELIHIAFCEPEYFSFHFYLKMLKVNDTPTIHPIFLFNGSYPTVMLGPTANLSMNFFLSFLWNTVTFDISPFPSSFIVV